MIRAIKENHNPKLQYIICGEGYNRQYLENLITELELDKQIHLLGFRNDIPNICHVADLYAFPSFREGLPVAMMEAMASGLPILASEVRGNVDLIKNGVNGYLLAPGDYKQWAEKIQYLFKHRVEAQNMGMKNKDFIKNYDKSAVKEQLFAIYHEQGILSS